VEGGDSFSGLNFQNAWGKLVLSENELDGRWWRMLKTLVGKISNGDETESMKLVITVVKAKDWGHLSALGLIVLAQLVEVMVAHGREAVVLSPSSAGGIWTSSRHLDYRCWARAILDPQASSGSLGLEIGVRAARGADGGRIDKVSGENEVLFAIVSGIDVHWDVVVFHSVG